MNFMQAVQELHKGRLIRRPHFQKGKALCYLQSKGIYFEFVLLNSEGLWPQHIYSLTISDVMADDWSVTDKPAEET